MKRSRDIAGENSVGREAAVPILELPGKMAYSDAFGKHLVNTLQTYGCALVRCSPELTLDLARCDTLARRFFAGDLRGAQDVSDKAQWTVPCPVGSFCGFHQPSPAKEVFRYRFGLEHALHRSDLQVHNEADVGPCRSCQNPDSCNFAECSSTNCFLRAMKRAARGLRELAMQLSIVLLTSTANTTWGADDAKVLLDDLIEDISFSSCGQAKSEGHAQTPALTLPIPPFDAFHYFNDAGSEPVPNCAPHVDPGIITLIPLAEVPGLAVRPPRQNNNELSEEIEAAAGSCDLSGEYDIDEWLGIEEHAHTSLRCSEDCHSIRKSRGDPSNRNGSFPCQQRLITVLAGEVLESLTACVIPAGEHKVIRPPPAIKDTRSSIPSLSSPKTKTTDTTQPRFSLVFDLQIPAANAALVQAEATRLMERSSRREAQPPLYSIQGVAGRRASS